jgi:hypothetical protein
MGEKKFCIRGHEQTPDTKGSSGCKVCENDRQREYRKNNLEKMRQYWRNRQIWSKYKITRERWQIQFDKQDGKCLGCGIAFDSSKRETKPCVDHDHKTGIFRGLLCHSCNRGIGLLKESVETLKRLIAYLTHAEQRASTEGCDIECSGQERLSHEKDFEHPPVGHSSVDDSITPL